MKIQLRGRKGRRGMSLVELAIAGMLLAIVLGSVTMVGRTSEKAYKVGAATSHLESRVAQAMERIVGELRIAIDSSLSLPPLGFEDEVTYVQATGIELGTVQTTSLRRIAFEYEAGELDNGIDDNGNDLVDEGQIVLIEDVNGLEHRHVITRWVPEFLEGELENGDDDNDNDLVDEPGFVLVRDGDTIVVRLTLEKRTTEGAVVRRSAQTSIRPRN